MSKEIKNIGCFGTKTFQNKILIKDFLFNLSRNYKDSTKIVTRGHAKEGAEFFIKKYALSFDLKYAEIPAACEKHTVYSINEYDYYDKTWNYRYFIQQINSIAIFCDMIFIFGISENNMKNEYKYKDNVLFDLINTAQKRKKDMIHIIDSNL